METGLGSYKQGIVSTKRIYTYFRRFLSLAGIEHKGLGYGPRLHDIRYANLLSFLTFFHKMFLENKLPLQRLA